MPILSHPQVAEIKRAVFRALTRLRAATIKESRGCAGAGFRRLGKYMALCLLSDDNQFLRISDGSFSVVSTPIFASKYSLESSRRDLQDLHTSAALLRPPKFSKHSFNLLLFQKWLFKTFVFENEICQL